MNKEEFRQIADGYHGNIIEKLDSIWIECRNKISSYYQDGTVAETVTTLCSVGIRYNFLFAEEATSRIIGGCYGITATAENVQKKLIRYGFLKKQQEQLSLF